VGGRQRNHRPGLAGRYRGGRVRFSTAHTAPILADTSWTSAPSTVTHSAPSGPTVSVAGTSRPLHPLSSCLGCGTRPVSVSSGGFSVSLCSRGAEPGCCRCSAHSSAGNTSVCGASPAGCPSCRVCLSWRPFSGLWRVRGGRLAVVLTTSPCVGVGVREGGPASPLDTRFSGGFRCGAGGAPYPP